MQPSHWSGSDQFELLRCVVTRVWPRPFSVWEAWEGGGRVGADRRNKVDQEGRLVSCGRAASRPEPFRPVYSCSFHLELQLCEEMTRVHVGWALAQHPHGSQQ